MHLLLAFIRQMHGLPGRNWPIGSYRIPWIPTESLVSDSDRKLSDDGKCRNNRDSCRNSGIPTLSDIRQLPIGIRYQGFRQLPTDSYRIRYSPIDFPIGSDGIQLSDQSSWVSLIIIISLALWYLISIRMYWLINHTIRNLFPDLFIPLLLSLKLSITPCLY